MKLIKGNAEMIKYLQQAKERKEWTAYFTEDDLYDGVQVATPSVFGSIPVRPYVPYDGEYDPTEIAINDTSFECDYDENTEFIVYNKEEVIRMIKVLMECL